MVNSSIRFYESWAESVFIKVAHHDAPRRGLPFTMVWRAFPILAPLAIAEVGTGRWSALKIAPSTLGVFDTFATERDR